MKLFKVFAAIIFVALLCLRPAPGQENSGRKSLKRIGVQLYTVRKELEKDFDGTLRRIAEIGFQEVEFASLFGRNPQDVRRLVEKLGMKAVGSHINWKTFKENPESAIEETKALGAKYMILAWFPPEERKTLDQWKEWANRLNQVGRTAKAKGIRLLYHNHDFEFQKIDGVEPFQLLLDTVDRRYVSFEIDLYWLTLGGRTPESVFTEYRRGFPLSHVKDMSKTEQAMVDVGDGRIDFAGIFAQEKVSGMKHFIVEHDNPKDPFETLKRSFNYLRALRY